MKSNDRRRIQEGKERLFAAWMRDKNLLQKDCFFGKKRGMIIPLQE